MKFSDCDWRFIARIVSIIHIPFSLLLAANMTIAMLLLTGKIKTTNLEGDALYEFHKEAEDLQLPYLIASLLLHLFEIPVAVILFLATSYQRFITLKSRKKCLAGTIVWLVVTSTSLILIFVDAHVEDLQYAFAVIYLFLITFVIPYLITFCKPPKEKHNILDPGEEDRANGEFPKSEVSMAVVSGEEVSAIPSTAE